MSDFFTSAFHIATQLISTLRDNTTTAFFFFLGFTVVLWTISFHFVFTKSCMTAFFRSCGVGNARTQKMFGELKRKR
jgi:hypothetical protein